MPLGAATEEDEEDSEDEDASLILLISAEEDSEVEGDGERAGFLDVPGARVLPPPLLFPAVFIAGFDAAFFVVVVVVVCVCADDLG